MDEIDKTRYWKIEQLDDKKYMVNSDGERHLYMLSDEVTHGDVLVVRDNNSVYKMHDGSSSSALVYVTNQCNSNCVMCPDSVKMRTKENTISFEELMEYVSLLPSDLKHIDITGGEPTLLKENLPYLIKRALEQAENAEVLMLSNGRSFAVDGYTQKFCVFSDQKFKIEIPIHSADKEKHDYIAGCKGSFEQTMRGIANLLKNGVEVGIRIVVSKLNYRELNPIIQEVKRRFPEIKYINIMGMEILGNAWKNKEIVWEEFENIKPYVEKAVEQSFSCGIEPGLYNFPLCLFEKKYWYCYKNSITDYKIRYFTECEECKEKSECGGFFFSTFRRTNYKVRVQR